jgi:hypothetical protein
MANYADYEKDLMTYFGNTVASWKTLPIEEEPVDLPISWFNSILKEENIDKENVFLRFDIIESRSYQPNIGREVGCTYKRIEGQMVVDIFYPYNYNYLKYHN